MRHSTSGSLALIAATTLGLNITSCSPAHRTTLSDEPATANSYVSGEQMIALQELGKIESRLQTVERMRAEALPVYGWLLVVPELHRRYDKACTHHELLCRKCRETRECILLQPAPDDTTKHWLLDTSDALEKIIEFINYVKKHHVVPAGWKPPSGFEYLKTLSSE